MAALEEVTRAYTLTVVAVDSGTPSRTGSALIQVLPEGVHKYTAVHVCVFGVMCGVSTEHCLCSC